MLCFVASMADLLAGCRPDCPWLVIQGSRDEVVAATDVAAWVHSLVPPPELVLLPGVDHFFHGRLTLLRDTVLAHVATPGGG